MTLIIFGENISDTTGYKINVLVSTSLNVCFCTTWGKQTKHNTCCNEWKKHQQILSILICGPNSRSITRFDCHAAVCLPDEV